MDTHHHANTTAAYIRECYQDGQRCFENIVVEEGDLNEQSLEGIQFDHCILAVNFENSNLKGAKFLNSNIKTCNFSNADLTNAEFRNVAIDGASFYNAKTKGVIFDNNTFQSQTLSQEDFRNLQ